MKPSPVTLINVRSRDVYNLKRALPRMVSFWISSIIFTGLMFGHRRAGDRRTCTI